MSPEPRVASGLPGPAGGAGEARLILFGGKGGVGKTTCAAATALSMAEGGRRVLLFSTDPAHSLGDSLEQVVGGEIVPVRGMSHLDVLEVDAERMLGRFKEENTEALREILTTSTYLDEDDVTELLSLTIPGLDEVMGLKKVMDLMEEGRYSAYVLDTAPTGHALRLLSMPEVVESWIRVVARMRYKYRSLVSTLAGRNRGGDSSDDLLFRMKRTIKRLKALLRDPARCEFVLVTIPQALAIEESVRLLKSLSRFGVPVRSVVVNGLVPGGPRQCRFCSARRSEQQRYTREIRSRFPEQRLVPLTMLPEEVRGLTSLRRLSAELVPALDLPTPACC